MSFVTKEWKDRLAEFAGRRKLTNVSTGEETTVDVSRAEGEVSQAGDAFSAANMNDLEQRIKDGFDKVDTNLDVTKNPPISKANANDYVDINITETNTPIGYDGLLTIGCRYASVSSCSVFINDIMVFVCSTNTMSSYVSGVVIPIPVCSTDVIRFSGDKPTTAKIYKYKNS